MSGLDRVELAQGGPFAYRVNGEVRGLPHPADMPYIEVLECLYLEIPPERPPGPVWHSDALFARWRAHYDLPGPRETLRLRYLVDRYSDEIEWDLRQHAGGADLGELWRSRQWRKLLNFIDRLPGYGHFGDAVANDDEHAELLAKAELERGENKDYHPPLRGWTPELAALNNVINAVNAVAYTIRAVKAEKPGQAGQPPEPMPTPRTALDRARENAKWRKRWENHRSIVAKVLPHKAHEPD